MAARYSIVGSSGCTLLTGHSLQTCDRTLSFSGISNQFNKSSETCN